jgi:hypothetical protein
VATATRRVARRAVEVRMMKSYVNVNVRWVGVEKVEERCGWMNKRVREMED